MTDRVHTGIVTHTDDLESCASCNIELPAAQFYNVQLHHLRCAYRKATPTALSHASNGGHHLVFFHGRIPGRE